MKRVWRWIAVLGLVIVLLLVIGGVLFLRAATPPAPSAFYTPPAPLPPGVPGTIIRSEPITTNLPEGAVAWRILYLSTGLQGEPIAVSGIVIAPEGESAAPRPVIAWAFGTLGVVPECGTSHRNDPFALISALDLMVREGFIVAATDYPGRGTPGIHPYLVGPVEAHAILDAVRAAQRLDAAVGDRFALWGASQGGHAVLWAAHRAPEYAPELVLVGAAAQAAAIDLPGLFEATLDRPIGGLLMSQALYAWGHTYPDADLDTIIAPERRAQFENLARTCLTNPLAFVRMREIPPLSAFLRADPLALEPWRTIVHANVPHGAIVVPLLITHGTDDPLIPLEGSVAEAARRCTQGEDVTLMRFPGVGHPGSDDTGASTIGWIQDRFAGRSTGPTCGR